MPKLSPIIATRCFAWVCASLSAPIAAGALDGLTAYPLNVQALRSGAPLFATVPAEQTGIRAENAYTDSRISGDLYREFDSSSIGTGVAIGDYDNDGRPDVFIVSKTESVRLFRNLGDWKFEDVTERAGVEDTGEDARHWKQGAAFADVNNDGWLDLYVCRFGVPNRLYINQRDGTFREEAAERGLALVDSSVMGAFSDYDRDGWLDVYVTTNILNAETHPSGQRGHLYRNRGHGYFAEVTTEAGINAEGQSHSALWWDHNDDGWPDLYVSFDYGVADRLYRNNRDGTFTDVIAQVLPYATFSSMGSESADVNNDGLPDLMVADMAATSHAADQRFIADARGRREEPAFGDKTLPMVSRNVLLLNTGTNRFIEAASLAGIATTDWTWSVLFEDLDNDGRVDLFATNGFHQTPTVDLIRAMTNADSVDERRRLLRASPVQRESNLAFRNRGDLHFEPVTTAWGLEHVGVSFGAAFGDLDGDGDLDLVYTNYREPVTVLRNQSDSANRVLVALRGRVSNHFGVGSKVTVKTRSGTQTRVLATARGYLSTSDPVLHFGLGQDAQIETLTVRWSSGHVQTFDHLAGNHRYVIREPEGRPHTLEEPARDEAHALFERIESADNSHPEPQAKPDDKRTRSRLPPLQRFIPRSANALAALVIEDASQQTALARLLPAPERVTAALQTDLNGDGAADMIVAEDWGQVRHLRAQAGGGFEDVTEETGFAASGAGWWTSLASADFNEDGRPDMAAGNIGLNTPYRAHSALYIGKDARTAAPAWVEAYREGGNEYPRASRRELAAALPWINRKYPTNAGYSAATLSIILGADRMEQWTRLEATQPRSGVWMSGADGKYEFSPLPWLAQVSPVTDMCAADLDGDQHMDLVLIQNVMTPPSAGGPYAGGVGVILRGDGRGNFAAMTPRESGFVVPGQPSAVETRDVNEDGWADIVVTLENGRETLYLNRGGTRSHAPASASAQERR